MQDRVAIPHDTTTNVIFYDIIFKKYYGDNFVINKVKKKINN